MSTLRETINGFRGNVHAARNQHDISSRALLFKRQLESLGLFPGLMKGTAPRKFKPEAGGARGERKRAARKLANVRTAWGNTQDPPIQHRNSSATRTVVGYDLPSLRKFASRGTRGTYTPHHPGRRGPDIQTLNYADIEKRVMARGAEFQSVVVDEAAHLAAIPAASFADLGTYGTGAWRTTADGPVHVPVEEIVIFTEASRLSVIGDGPFSVLDRGTNLVMGTYKDRKTANRRVRQLNEA